MISVSPSDKDTVTVRKGGLAGELGVEGRGGGWGGGAMAVLVTDTRWEYRERGTGWSGGGGGVEEGRVVKVTCLGMTLVIHYRFFFCSDDFSN